MVLFIAKFAGFEPGIRFINSATTTAMPKLGRWCNQSNIKLIDLSKRMEQTDESQVQCDQIGRFIEIFKASGNN